MGCMPDHSTCEREDNNMSGRAQRVAETKKKLEVHIHMCVCVRAFIAFFSLVFPLCVGIVGVLSASVTVRAPFQG